MRGSPRGPLLRHLADFASPEGRVLSARLHRWARGWELQMPRAKLCYREEGGLENGQGGPENTHPVIPLRATVH